MIQNTDNGKPVSYEDKREHQRISISNQALLQVELTATKSRHEGELHHLTEKEAIICIEKKLEPGMEIKICLSEGYCLESVVEKVAENPVTGKFETSLKFKEEVKNFVSLFSDYIDIESMRQHKRGQPEKKMFIEIWNPQDDSALRDIVQLIDLSAGGCRVRSPRWYEKGEIIQLKLNQNKTQRGEVRWCSEDKGVDVAFTIETDGIKKLDKRKKFLLGVMFVPENTQPQNKEKKLDLTERKQVTQTDHKKISETLHMYNKEAIELRKGKKFTESLESFKKAIELEPHNEVLYYNLARLFLDEGKITEAIKALEYSATLHSDFHPAKELLKTLKNKKPLS